MIISNTFIFIFGLIVFGVWIVASFIEFRKMDKHPEDYKDRRTFKSVSDGKEEL